MHGHRSFSEPDPRYRTSKSDRPAHARPPFHSVVLTLWPIPRKLLLSPNTWTALLWGNAATPLGLLLVRCVRF